MPLNAETAAVLALFASQATKPFEELGVLRSRRMVDLSTSLQGERVRVASVDDVLAEVCEGDNVGESMAAGTRRIPIRLYHPVVTESGGGPQPRPLIVYFHGGGWATGNVEVADRPARALCQGAGAVVASVEYRLAPEAPFPAGLEDCYAAVQWLSRHVEQLGVDPDKIVVFGDSAGGNLAAATTLLSRERGGHPIAHQILLYPALAPAERSPYPSYAQNSSGYSLTRAGMKWFWELYLASAADALNPLASPLLAQDVSGLPSATIITAEFDPLRDEGAAYAQRLRDVGSDAELVEYAGTIHGFFWMAGHLSQAKTIVGVIADALNRRFTSP
ncbi:alpha/beta hydrolase [Cryobacterium suzukii]|uniref:Alpha/beta hydrolase n=1 Tax=Cryobacterium suzukii TaxID=1259198 RepID=A0A4R9AHQ4_9MICO|nr:alpha/beta hydrolase [Cryobacterium suzukii]TFD62186.1 alpha/beta hydrolase [Cryobacterium suzukii]